LYDTPADINPDFVWDEQNNSELDGVNEPLGAGLLQPGVDYRLTYTLLLDNLTLGELGSALGEIEFVVGDSPHAAQPGDTDDNGRVDLADLNNVRNHFGEQGEAVPGDTPPFDGAVDLADLNAVRNYFGQSSSQSAPEPAAVYLATMGAAVLVWTLRYSRRVRDGGHSYSVKA
jgi:hypothetical protein